MPALTLRLIGGANPVPDHMGDDRRTMVGNDHDLHTVVEREGFGVRLRGGERAGKESKQAEAGKSSHQPAALELHEITFAIVRGDGASRSCHQLSSVLAENRGTTFRDRS